MQMARTEPLMLSLRPIESVNPQKAAKDIEENRSKSLRSWLARPGLEDFQEQ
jgi:hypothetical protein